LFDFSAIAVDKSMFDTANMAEPGDPPIYAALMRVKPGNLSPNAWAAKAKVGRAVWSDIRRHGNPTRKTLAKLLERSA
jgi:hypothetical protein